MLTVYESGQPIDFTFADLMKYHGPEFPGGVAHGFTVMRHAFSILGDVERREVLVRTAFPGPGGRDAVEMVLRAVTDGRYVSPRNWPRPNAAPHSPDTSGSSPGATGA